MTTLCFAEFPGRNEMHCSRALGMVLRAREGPVSAVFATPCAACWHQRPEEHLPGELTDCWGVITTIMTVSKQAPFSGSTRSYLKL